MQYENDPLQERTNYYTLYYWIIITDAITYGRGDRANLIYVFIYDLFCVIYIYVCIYGGGMCVCVCVYIYIYVERERERERERSLPFHANNRNTDMIKCMTPLVFIH